MEGKKFFFGLMLVFVALFLAVVIGIGFLFAKHTFRASVSGRISATEGNPISGAKVRLYIGGSDGSSNNFESITDESGYYSIQTPTLRYALDSSAAYRSIGISANGYVPVSVNKRVAKGNNRNWDFVLTEAVSVSGRLVNMEGEPMADSNLSFLPGGQADSGSNLRYCSVAVTTDEGGNFNLDTVGPFEYRILIDEHGLKLYRQRPVNGENVDLADIANRQGLEICINNPLDYTISGHVKDSDGNSVKESFVWVCNENFGTWGAYSDQQGAFRIIGLDGLGKDVFDINVKGKTLQGERFTIKIPDVRLHTDNLSFIVQ